VRDLDDAQLIAVIERAYDEKGTKDITEKDLLEWLHRNNLTSEEAVRAIDVAEKQRKIRFCIVSSVGMEKHVPCYERLTNEDLKLEEELGGQEQTGRDRKGFKIRKTKLPRRKQEISSKTGSPARSVE
jgi:hypothetical protein